MRIFIILTLLSFSFLEASSRREARKTEDLGYAVIDFQEKEPAKVLDKNALRSYRHLHRQGLKAFHQKRYEEGLQCFGLGLQDNPRSADLTLDYALFSLLVPKNHGRNLTLAKNLLEQLVDPKAKLDSRFYLSRAIINWLEGQDQQAEFNLSHLKETPYEEISDLFLIHLQLDARAINHEWAERVIPIRLSPLEKRKKKVLLSTSPYFSFLPSPYNSATFPANP